MFFFFKVALTARQVFFRLGSVEKVAVLKEFVVLEQHGRFIEVMSATQPYNLHLSISC